MTQRKRQRTHPRVAAESFLHETGITEPPIPVKKLLKTKCQLFRFDDKSEDGFTCLTSTGIHVYINRNENIVNGRLNFTYAHELGHIILGHLNIDCFSSLGEDAYWRLDREANLFAANLLMPSNMILSQIKIPVTTKEVGRMKELFQVSWEAMNNRLNTLGIQKKDKPKNWLAQCPVCSTSLAGGGIG